MTDLGPQQAGDGALRWLLENEAQLAEVNEQWVALFPDGPRGSAEDLRQLVERFGLDEAVYHYVAFAKDVDGRPILPRPT